MRFMLTSCIYSVKTESMILNTSTSCENTRKTKAIILYKLYKRRNETAQGIKILTLQT